MKFLIIFFFAMDQPWPLVAAVIENIITSGDLKKEFEKQKEMNSEITEAEILQRLVKFECSHIESVWMNENKNVISEGELRRLHDRVAGETPESPYRSRNDICKIFFERLHSRLVNDIYHSSKACYTFDELQNIVPYVDSLFFSREIVIYCYMSQMDRLKSRGDIWKAQMRSLKDIIVEQGKAHLLLSAGIKI